ncbi:MAG: YhdP family protein, partial [Burkholderiales bacterium]
LADVKVETDLAGIKSDLPAPLGKDAASAIPLRFERTAVAADQDRISVSYGNVVAARIERAGKKPAVTRGTVSFGAPAPQPRRDGVWVSGTLPELDLDRWLDILDQFPGSSQPALAGIDVKIGALDAVQHRFTNLSIQATQQGGDWRAQLAGPELVGSVNWRSASGGKLTARMQKLTVPPANPKPATAAADNAKRSNYPAIDLIADDFLVKNRHLGQLQLEAVPQGSDWRIDKLLLDNPDGALTINGVWHGNPVHPHTDVKVNLDVGDIGKFLTRLGYPDGVSHGTAKLSGPLSWNGFVEDIDYPSLSGQLTLHAANGQFVKMKPGIGKLLGILSLQA